MTSINYNSKDWKMTNDIYILSMTGKKGIGTTFE